MPHRPDHAHETPHDATGSDHPDAPTQEDYLGGKAIIPERITPDMNVADLIDATFQAYNSARLSEACRLYAQKMLDPANDVTIALTVAGAMTPAGVGGAIITLMERGAIDLVVSTGANLYHDIHHALAYTLHRGRFDLSDIALQEAGVIRIYDVLFPDQVLLDTDAWLRDAFKRFPQRAMSTAELHYHIGRRLLEVGVKPEYSVVAMAAQWGIPLFTSSPGDSSIGMNVARHQLDGGGLTIDPFYDVHETTAIVLDAKQNGVIILGGGSPRTSICKRSRNSGRCWASTKAAMIISFRSPPTHPIGADSRARRPPKRSPGARSNPIICRTASSSMATRRLASRC